jgi:hypothetical protein
VTPRVSPLLRWRLRRAARRVAEVTHKLGLPVPPSLLENNRNPFDGISWRGERELWRDLRRNPWQLLDVPRVREILARERLATYLKNHTVRALKGDPEKAAHDALAYNLEALTQGASGLDRPITLFRPLMSIGRVAREVASMKVLAIGPRSEIEIFSLLACGFREYNISAVDLFSYSPFVDVGDMHALPYPENSFDVVTLAWVLPYSRDLATVGKEVSRVARNGAIIAVATDYNDATTVNPRFAGTSSHIQTCQQIFDMFPGQARTVYFQHEPDERRDQLVMTIFALQRV